MTRMSPDRFDQRAEHVHPHEFANAAERDAGEHEQEAEREPPAEGCFQMQEDREVGGEDARLRGDRGQSRADQRKPDHEAQERQAEGALGDVGGTCGARIARPERGIRERGEQRCDQRHHEG